MYSEKVLEKWFEFNLLLKNKSCESKWSDCLNVILWPFVIFKRKFINFFHFLGFAEKIIRRFVCWDENGELKKDFVEND